MLFMPGNLSSLFIRVVFPLSIYVPGSNLLMLGILPLIRNPGSITQGTHGCLDPGIYSKFAIYIDPLYT